MINMTEEAKAFAQKHDITSGWTQEQHVGLVFNTITDALGIESKEDKAELLGILNQTVNPSAFRQKLESKGILSKVDSASAASKLANKYATL